MALTPSPASMIQRPRCFPKSIRWPACKPIMKWWTSSQTLSVSKCGTSPISKPVKVLCASRATKRGCLPENANRKWQRTISGNAGWRFQTLATNHKCRSVHEPSRGGDMPEKSFDVEVLFDVRGRTAVITGGSGVLGSAMTHTLSKAGVRVAILSLHAASSANVVKSIRAEGGEAIGIACDVMERADLVRAYTEVLDSFGHIDMLINAAGGNSPHATTSATTSFFDLDVHAVDAVLGLNFTGTFQSCQIFGRAMAERKQGIIVNIVSMNALRPLTRIPAYSAAKAAVANFTQWLAVHMAQEYSPAIRVNALAPGFFLTEQNRFLMLDAASGEPTTRGQAIISHTPMGRLGAPEDLVGTLFWLVSPASTFVTGVVIPVDGGFSSFSGV